MPLSRLALRSLRPKRLAKSFIFQSSQNERLSVLDAYIATEYNPHFSALGRAMSEVFRINQNLYEALLSLGKSHFTISVIRDHLLEFNGAQDNKQAVRLAVSRQLRKLEEAGLVKSSGDGRRKSFEKTERFDTVRFEFKKNRQSKCLMATALKDESKNIYESLRKEKVDIESELTIALDEIEQFKMLMHRSDTMREILASEYNVATRKAASLMAKLNVWAKAIELTAEHRGKQC
ncbi:hypothetical protein [Enterovibrio paralichthyis]|uniref:hypothetical protein n=1 Tax=Enterovibrio paralichthyis TaxID=2853805 RepID=UPI001C48955C|nr:hypothetical protein [Enterovibrio paralichthyis]MBV7297710.1 hypothetical protein [Enterovibrio paralichthyis]